MAMTPPFKVCWSILNEVVDVGVMVYASVRVSPIAETVTVAPPGRRPDTVVTNCPLESVEPDATEKLTPPPPDWLSVTGIPDALFPPASLICTVRVVVDVPLSGNELMGDVTSTVEPLIRIGICVETPLALAVIVAVRVEMLVEPEEKPTLP